MATTTITSIRLNSPKCTIPSGVVEGVYFPADAEREWSMRLHRAGGQDPYFSDSAAALTDAADGKGNFQATD